MTQQGFEIDKKRETIERTAAAIAGRHGTVRMSMLVVGGEGFEPPTPTV